VADNLADIVVAHRLELVVGYRGALGVHALVIRTQDKRG
jgi:hypothetical protein